MKPNVPQLILATLVSASGLSAQTSPEDIQEAVDASFGPWDVRIRDKVGYITTAWSIQNLVTLDGDDAAELRPPVSPYISSATLGATVTGPGKLYFSYLSGRPAWGAGTTVKVGSAFAVLLPPGFSWQEGSIDLGPGSQQVTWAFATAGIMPSASSFLDQIWTEDDPRPRVTSGGVLEAFQGQAATYQTVTNKPCDSFVASGLPPGMALGAATGVITGTPTELGSFNSRITVTNAVGSHVAPLLVRVMAPSPTAAVSLGTALDGAGITWSQQGGSEVWSGSATAFSHDATDAATFPVRANPAAGETFSWLSCELQGPGTFSFWQQALRFPNESETPPGGVLRMHQRFDGTDVSEIFGSLKISSEWTQRIILIPNGRHRLEFRAVRDSYEPPDTDILLLLDQASFAPGPLAFTWLEWLAKIGGHRYSDPKEDNEGDGLGLLVEYALGGSIAYHDAALLPQIEIIDGHLTMTVRKAQGTSGLEYTVQANKSLAGNGWTTFGTEIMNEDEHVLIVRCKKTVAEEPTCMLRLRVRLDDSVGA